MSKRETRVINVFINCVKHGEYSFNYACLLIEDSSKYGWLSESAKDVFYSEFENDRLHDENVQADDDEILEEE